MASVSLMVLVFFVVLNIVFTIPIGIISNTIYITSGAARKFSNMTCTQCTCSALTAGAVGWNCVTSNETCQLISNYSSTDGHLVRTINGSFFFQQFPPEPLLIGSHTTVETTATTAIAAISSSTTSTSTSPPTTRMTSETRITSISTTSAVTVCSTTAITTTVTSSSLPPQCSNYTLNTDETRNAAYTILGNACDDLIFTPSPKWIRFSGAAGTLLANCPVVNSHCNTNSAGWYSGVYPSTAGDTTHGTVCYTWPGYTCLYNNSISVTNCNGYYVFALASSPRCSLRYCTIG